MALGTGENAKKIQFFFATSDVRFATDSHDRKQVANSLISLLAEVLFWRPSTPIDASREPMHRIPIVSDEPLATVSPNTNKSMHRCLHVGNKFIGILNSDRVETVDCIAARIAIDAVWPPQKGDGCQTKINPFYGPLPRTNACLMRIAKHDISRSIEAAWRSACLRTNGGKLVSFMWKNCRKDVALTFDFYTNSRSGCCSFEEVGLVGCSIRRGPGHDVNNESISTEGF